MKTIVLKSRTDGLKIGDMTTVKVNCNIGANNITQYYNECQRIESIVDSGILPDCFMDLSLMDFSTPLYKILIDKYGFPAGVVPTYLLGDKSSCLAMDLLKRYADSGISFFTLHLTTSLELFEKSKSRLIPMTSRGGGILLRRMKEQHESNIWLTLLPKIIDLVREYDIAISLGTTFRPGGIKDACDEVHLLETRQQLELCKFLQNEGIKVMVENVGHISLDFLERHCALLREFDAPIMPLGPSPTDCAENMDDVAGAIGASFMGYCGCAHMINCVTSVEHSRSFATIEETINAIRMAKLSAHIIDVAHGLIEEDKLKYEQRAQAQSCIVGEDTTCSRCRETCPLKIM